MDYQMSDDSKQVSIGMPVFNDEKYIDLAISSLLAQTHFNFELIISDNGSTDSTKEICLGYSRKDPRIRYIRQSTNIGAGANFSFVLKEAKGEFFLWAASDNIHDADFLSALLKMLVQDEQAVSAFSPYTDIDETGKIVGGRIEQDFSSATGLRRLCKFWRDPRANRDVWFYGLHRREVLLKTEIPEWWGLNRTVLLDRAYPVLSYLLASGKYLYFREKPLFLRRVHLNSPPRHSAEYSGRMCLNFVAMCLRKLNLLLVTVADVYQGTRSMRTASLIAPVIACECTRFIAEYVAAGLRYKIFKQKQGYVS